MMSANRKGRIRLRRRALSATFSTSLNRPTRTKRPAKKGIEATVVAVKDDKVFFDVGQKIEGVMPASMLRDEQGGSW